MGFLETKRYQGFKETGSVSSSSRTLTYPAAGLCQPQRAVASVYGTLLMVNNQTHVRRLLLVLSCQGVATICLPMFWAVVSMCRQHVTDGSPLFVLLCSLVSSTSSPLTLRA